MRLRTLAEVIDYVASSGATGNTDGAETGGRRPATEREDRDTFVSGENRQNAVTSMMVADGEGRVLWCSPTMPGSCADITHARQLRLVKRLAAGPAVEVPTDAGYQGLGPRPVARW